MDLRKKYNTFIKEVLKSLNGKDVSAVKELFVSEISSSRAFKRIHTIEELLFILEKRDCLSPKNISCLRVIGDILRNEDVKHLVQTYEKYNLLDEPMCCSLCHREENPCIVTLTKRPILQPSLPSCATIQDDKDLHIAIEALSLKLGRHWPALLRVLEAKECVIDAARKLHEDFVRQAKFALCYWCQYNKASVDILKAALNDRECKRLGLGPDMIKLEPCLYVLIQ